VGITAGSREVPGRNSCDKRHTYCIIIIIIIIIIILLHLNQRNANKMAHNSDNRKQEGKYFLR